MLKRQHLQRIGSKGLRNPCAPFDGLVSRASPPARRARSLEVRSRRPGRQPPSSAAGRGWGGCRSARSDPVVLDPPPTRSPKSDRGAGDNFCLPILLPPPYQFCYPPGKTYEPLASLSFAGPCEGACQICKGGGRARALVTSQCHPQIRTGRRSPRRRSGSGSGARVVQKLGACQGVGSLANFATPPCQKWQGFKAVVPCFASWMAPGRAECGRTGWGWTSTPRTVRATRHGWRTAGSGSSTTSCSPAGPRSSPGGRFGRPSCSSTVG